METDYDTSSINESTGVKTVHEHMFTATLVIYCLIFIFGTLGNGLVIYVTGCRMKSSVNSVWFLNLALADFLFTTFLIFLIISLSRQHEWPFGQFMCKFSNFVSLVNMFASVFLLTAISLDRCLSIWVVVWAQNKRTLRKAQVACVAIWVTAAICSIPFSTFRDVQEVNGVSICGYPGDLKQKWILYSFRFVMGFLIPFLVILVSYVAIAIRARRIQKARKRRSRRIICSVIVAFFICWLPYHIMSFLELKLWTNQESDFLIDVVMIGGPLTMSLAFMNSCLNPILYVFMCDEFQKKLRQSVCFVLESALAEDHLSFMSSRSLSAHFSRVAQKSDSAPPEARQDTATCLTLTESKDTTSTG